MLVANLAAVGAAALLLLVRTSAAAWLALVAVGLIAVAKAFYSPAAQAALPNVVDEVDRPAANALAGSAWGTMLVVGASLGGLTSARFGPYTCFVVAAGCLLLAAALLWRVRRPLQASRERADGPARPFVAVAEAMRYVRRQPRVAALVTVKSAVGFGNGVLATFPLLAIGVFGVGEIGVGLLFAVRGAGALVGPLLMRRVLGHQSWLLPGMAVSMGLYGVAYLGVAVSPGFGVVLVLVALAHLAGAGNWVMSNVALQNEVPDELRGRIFATDMMIAMIAVSSSQVAAGALVDHVDTRVLIAAFGSVTLGYALIWRLITARMVRRDAARVVGEPIGTAP